MTSSPTEPPKLVYVVEDDEEQLMILRLILSGAGFQVVTETNADRVLDGVRELKPDIILMDVMLPSRKGLDGFALCSQIRTDPALQHVKIIIVSAIAQGVGELRDKVRTQSGADDFVFKPYDPPVLIARINQLLA